MRSLLYRREHPPAGLRYDQPRIASRTERHASVDRERKSPQSKKVNAGTTKNEVNFSVIR